MRGARESGGWARSFQTDGSSVCMGKDGRPAPG